MKIITVLPMLIILVGSYSPSHSPWISLALPPRQIVRWHGGELRNSVQLRLSSESNSSVSLLENFQPAEGGWSGSSSTTLALSQAISPSSPTSHSPPRLEKRYGGDTLSPVQQVVLVAWYLLRVSLLVHRAVVFLTTEHQFVFSKGVATVIRRWSTALQLQF